MSRGEESGLGWRKAADRLLPLVFFLLLTGERPDAEAKAAFQRELDRRSQVPDYVWNALKALPRDTEAKLYNVEDMQSLESFLGAMG